MVCNMAPGCIFILIVLLAIPVVNSDLTKRKSQPKKYQGDKYLWKKEYEDELNEAMLSTSKKGNNTTRVVQSTFSDNEAVVEKLIDSMSSNEKYLKKVDSIDFRLNRLDIEVHEKTNNIMKQLAEISKSLRTSEDNPVKTDTMLDGLKSQIHQLKYLIENNKINNVEGADSSMVFHADSSMDTRLTNLENQIKNIMAGVESIVSIISEVKSRQLSRTLQKGPQFSTLESVGFINEFRKSLHDQKKSCDCKMGKVDRSERYPTDCHEIQSQGFNVSGIYKIRPDEMDPFYVLCDLVTAGGGWTVLQNRFDGSQDFYKGWNDYKNGFGNLAGEFWLGLDKIHYLTNQKLYELRIEMETQNGQEAFAIFSVFTVGPEYEGYRISTLGTYYGTAGDSLSYHAGEKFSTFDTDNDEWNDGACAVEHGGAWWYKECDKSNLNGKYTTTATDEPTGQSIYWISFKGPSIPLTKTKMMIRPLPPSRPNDAAGVPMKQPDSAKLRPRPEITKKKVPHEDLRGGSPYKYNSRAGGAFFPNYN